MPIKAKRLTWTIAVEAIVVEVVVIEVVEKVVVAVVVVAVNVIVVTNTISRSVRQSLSRQLSRHIIWRKSRCISGYIRWCLRRCISGHKLSVKVQTIIIQKLQFLLAQSASNSGRSGGRTASWCSWLGAVRRTE